MLGHTSVSALSVPKCEWTSGYHKDYIDVHQAEMEAVLQGVLEDENILENNADDLAFLEDFEEKKIKEDEKASPNGATADAEPKLRERLQVCSALSHPPFRS